MRIDPTPASAAFTRDTVELAPGVAAPRELAATIHLGDDDEPPCTVEMHIAYDGDRFRCTRFTVASADGGPPVDTDLIRTFGVASLVAQVVPLTVERQRLAPGRRSTTVGEPVVPSTFDPSEGPTDDALRTVAAVYQVAYACGQPPTRQVEEVLGLARATAGRWIRAARDRGYLGQTTKGKKGGSA